VIETNCSASATACYSIITMLPNATTGKNDTTFEAPVNASWPAAFSARGCFVPSLSAYFQCPLAAEKHPRIPPAFANQSYAVLQDNATTGGLVFHLCCNTTMCNNISASGTGEGSGAAGSGLPTDGDDRAADLFFEEGPMVNPVPGQLETLDLIMLGATAFLASVVGLIVDFAHTGRGPFAES